MRRDVLSRRQALALPLALIPPAARIIWADQSGVPVRLAISQNVVGAVNLNDARAAMQVWVKRLTADLNVIVDPKLFSTTEEIVDRARKGQLDAVALDTLEFLQIANVMDTSQIVNSAGDRGFERYLILTRQSSQIGQLAELKGRRLCQLKTSKTCLAAAWLSTVLEEHHLPQAEQFFGPVTTEGKFSRVVLPVFFGQVDACLTTQRGFETMRELNPQVGRELRVIAESPPLIVSFYIFRKNYRSAEKDRVIRAISGLRNSPDGQELATLFQFDALAVRDGSALTVTLGMLDAADRIRARQPAGGRR